MCLDPEERARSSAERISALAASLAVVVGHHGIPATPDQLVSLLKSDWAMVAKYAHKIHEGDRRAPGRKDRRVEEAERLRPAHAEWCASVAYPSSTCSCRQP